MLRNKPAAVAAEPIESDTTANNNGGRNRLRDLGAKVGGTLKRGLSFLDQENVVTSNSTATGAKSGRGVGAATSTGVEDVVPPKRLHTETTVSSESIMVSNPRAISGVFAMSAQQASDLRLTREVIARSVDDGSTGHSDSHEILNGRSVTDSIVQALDVLELDVEDIDEFDHDDPMQCTAYVDGIFEVFRSKELEARPNPRYLQDFQQDLNELHREKMIDWIVATSTKFGLLTETTGLAVYVLDRFLSLKRVSASKLLMVTAGCLMVAAKYEDVSPPLVDDYVYATNGQVNASELLRVEKIVLMALDWNLTVPVPLYFLRRYSKAAHSDSRVHTLSKYLMELATMDYGMLRFLPSMIAAAAVYLARSMAQISPPWNATLQFYSGFSAYELASCARALNQLVAVPISARPFLRSLRSKYSSTGYLQVSTIPPLSPSSRALDPVPSFR